MYEFINTSTGEKFTIEKPRYVKQNRNGILVKCTSADAQCISIEGILYSIFGKPPFDGAPEILFIREVDGGTQIQNVLKENAEALRERLKQAETLEEVKHCIEDIYECLFDFYENRYSETDE